LSNLASRGVPLKRNKFRAPFGWGFAASGEFVVKENAVKVPIFSSRLKEPASAKRIIGGKQKINHPNR